jgi:hypothetical protein
MTTLTTEQVSIPAPQRSSTGLTEGEVLMRHFLGVDEEPLSIGTLVCFI